MPVTYVASRARSELTTLNAPLQPNLDLKPLLIINADSRPNFLCLVHKLSAILTALDYKPH